MLRLLILLLLACPAASQTLTGVITDGSVRLPGATVVLLQGERVVAGTSADSQGAYRLDARAPGTYRLRASFVGFGAFETDVTLTSGQTQTRDIVLDARALPGDEVVVAAGRPASQAPVTVSNVTAAELEALPQSADLPVLLATQPGVTFSSEGGGGIGYTSLRLRGFDQRRVAVSINGVPQNDPEDLGVFWLNFYDMRGSVTDVQVQRGAASAAYGQSAVAGAVNIAVDPFRPQPYAFAEVGYGAFDTRKATVEANTGLLGSDAWGGRWAGYLRLSRTQTDGYRRGAWVDADRVFGGVTRYGERSRVTLLAFGGPQRDGLAYSGIPKGANDGPFVDESGTEFDRRSNYSDAFGENERFNQPHVYLHHDLSLSGDLDLSQTLFWVRGDGHFDFDATFRSADYLRLPSGFVPDSLRQADLFTSAPGTSVFLRAAIDQNQVGWMPRLMRRLDWGSVTLGGEARLHRSLRWGRIQEAVGIPDGLVGSENDVRIYSFRGEKAVASGFASVLARPSDLVAVQYETRLTWRQYRIYDEAFFGTDLRAPFTFWDHRAGATLFPDRSARFYANVALASREPRLKTIYDGEVAGTGFVPQVEGAASGRVEPLVQPERGITAEVAGEWEGVRSRLRVGGYGYWVRGEIVPLPRLDQFGVPITDNADRTRHLGVEIEGSVRLARGLDLSGHLTLSRDRFVRFDEVDAVGIRQDRSGNSIAGFPSRSGYAALSYTRGGFSARIDAVHAGATPVDNSGRGGDAQVDAYTLVGAGVRYRLPGPMRGLELSAEVQNLLDDNVLLSGNTTAFGPQFFPAATRSAYLTARYTVGRTGR